MPEGFHVKLGSIELFKQTVDDTIKEYNSLANILKEGDINVKNPSYSDLLGYAKFDGSSRAHDASHAMLTKYATLYDGIQRASEAIKSQLTHISQALGDTHQLYSELDSKHEAVFQRFLDENPTTTPDGGSRGATGQE
jgi:hypothetical protein